MEIEQRFWEKVDWRTPDDDDCWEWIASTDRHGYGQFRFQDTMVRAHRMAYELLVGPISEELADLDHLCKNPLCVNPEHLEPVTHAENNRRSTSPSALNVLKTHCPQGHAYDEANTYRKHGRRGCRICNRAAVARYAAKRKGEG